MLVVQRKTEQPYLDFCIVQLYEYSVDAMFGHWLQNERCCFADTTVIITNHSFTDCRTQRVFVDNRSQRSNASLLRSRFCPAGSTIERESPVHAGTPCLCSDGRETFVPNRSRSCLQSRLRQRPAQAVQCRSVAGRKRRRASPKLRVSSSFENENDVGRADY